MRMHSRIFVAAIGLAVASALALAQAPDEAPKPGVEHKRLDFFVGKWKTEGEMKPNPFMPAGKFTSTENCEKFEGGFAVVCRSEGSGPMGPVKGLGITGYSIEEQAYTYYGLDSGPMAMASVPRGRLEGDTWTFTDEAKMGGKLVKSRFIMKMTSPTSYAFRWEMLGENGVWATVVEGTAKKSP